MNGEYLDISTNEVELTEEERKKAYMKEWREKHREHIRAYNKKHHIQIRQEASDIYYLVSEMRSFKLKYDKLLEEIISLRECINQLQLNPTSKLKVELEPEIIPDLEKSLYTIPSSQKSYIPDILENTERTPTQSPVPVIPETLEIKKIKKIRKVKVKKPVSPTLSVTSVESYTTPSKFSKNLIDEVLDDLIDSDGNVIMSESDY
jgi:hypothetical protein